MSEAKASWTEAFVALGANLGAPAAALRSALTAIAADPEIRLLKTSSFYRTSPVDSSGPDYVNGVALVSTTRSPEDLLARLQDIENENGRVRPAGVHNAPRTLDLDLLTYGREVRSSAQLTLPHPRMTERLFVLVPMAEIAPTWRDGAGRPIEALIKAVRAADPSQFISKL